MKLEPVFRDSAKVSETNKTYVELALKDSVYVPKHDYLKQLVRIWTGTKNND